MSRAQQILGSDGFEKLRAYTLQKESGGNYAVENQFGFIGGYQMGTPALKDIGLVRRDAPNDNNALNNPANWNNPPGSKAAFLANPALQDQAYAKLTDTNLRYLSSGSNAVVNANTPPEQVAGYLGAAHLVGAGAVKSDPTMSKRDGNGVSALSRYQGSAGAVSGKTVTPPATAARPGAAAPGASSATPAAGQVFTGQGVALRESSFDKDIVVTYRAQQQFNVPLPIENTLSNYASFNYIFTLSSLTPQQLNFPEESYRKGNIGKVILRSGGGGDQVQSLAATTSDNASGKYEFFIQDLSYEMLMVHNRKTKGSNATEFNFTVVEPYSMGQFLQALAVASLENGYKTGYINSPFLLTVEFVGFDDSGKAQKIPNTTRYFPLRILGADMSVTASGSTYKVNALAWNEIAMSDSANFFKSDVGISGGTVQEILQSGEFSLQTVLNKRAQEMAGKESKATTPDEIVIVFPKEMTDPAEGNRTASSAAGSNSNPSGFVGASADGNAGEAEAMRNMQPETQGTATVDPSEPPDMTTRIETRITTTRGANNIRTQSKESLNEIGLSSLEFDQTQAGESTPVKPDEATPDPSKPPVRKNVRWDAKKRQFIFSQGSTIINAISNVVTISKYCKDTADGKVKPDAQGMVPWFRIESEVYINPAKAGNVGLQKPPFLLIYKVVPYMVHHSIFSDKKSQSKGVEELKKEAAKEYNYIYSGKNTDVLSFELNFNMAFQTPTTADKGKLADAANLAATGAAAMPNTVTQASDNTPGETETNSAGIQPGQQLARLANSGGTTATDHRTIVAELFNTSLLNSKVDLLTGEMTILGDPYYIADSGIGNFSNTGSGRINITKDYAMDYQARQPTIVINFRTPTDYGPDGIMKFPEGQIIQEFSGIYFVDTVVNNFQKGQFTQVLSLRRLINQVTKPQQTEEDPEVAARARGSESIFVEDGQRSNLRRNIETGELYDATGLYDDKGKLTPRATVNPQAAPRVSGARPVRPTRPATPARPAVDAVPPAQTFHIDYPAA